MSTLGGGIVHASAPASPAAGGVAVAPSPMLATFALVTLTCVSLLDGVLPGARYVKYLIGPVVVLLWLVTPPGGRHLLYLKDYVQPFVFLAVYMLVLLPTGNYIGLKNCFFVLTYMSYFILFPDVRLNMRTINLMIVAVFLPMLFIGLGKGIDVSVTSSTASLESTLSLVFGLFAAYFVIRRRYAFFMLNFFAALVTLKRIALLGCLVVLVLHFMPLRVRRVLLSMPVAVAANVLVVVVLLMFAQGYFDAWIREQFGVSASALSMGRYFLYQSVSGELVSKPLQFLWSGLGPGTTDQLIAGIIGVEKAIHSDLLRLVSELGLVAFLGFMILLYSVQSLEKRLLTVYINVIFITGNALTYVHVMAVFLLLLSQFATADPDPVDDGARQGPANRETGRRGESG